MIRFRNLIEALDAAPAERPFVTAWIDEDEQETVTFAEFRRRARRQAGMLRGHGVETGDRVIIIMPQDIAAMTTFVGAMMLGAVPAFLAYPNFKVEPAKYRFGLAGVSKNLSAKAVVIDEDFPEDLLGHVSLSEGTKLIRAGAEREAGKDGVPLKARRDSCRESWRSSNTPRARRDCRRESRSRMPPCCASLDIWRTR